MATGPLADRDAALVPIERELVKRLKRTLADEENEVLDLLRRTKPSNAEDLLGSVDDHASRWAAAASEALGEAAAAGAASSGGEAADAGSVPAELGQAVVAPFRERVDRIFASADGDLDVVADRLRALYREWKGRRLNDVAAHHSLAAHAVGRLGAIPEGAGVSWLVGGDDPCPDCADNGLGGSVTKGEPFPTGQPSPPAHVGCRCMVVVEA